MKTTTLHGNHGHGDFTVEGVKVGRLFIQQVLVDDGDDGDWIEYQIAHAGTLFKLPGAYRDQATAIAAARQIDKLVDWDAWAPILRPAGNCVNISLPVRELGLRVVEIAQRHGADAIPVRFGR